MAAVGRRADLDRVVKADLVGPAAVLDDQLEAFCLAHRDRVLGLLALYTGDLGLAEQLAQDAFVRVCDHWSRVRLMEHPDRWLTTVAINGANSWFRRRAAERRATARRGADPVADAQVDTAQSIVDTAEAVMVRQAVAGLPRRQRQAVVLRYYDDLTVAETAASMRCAEGTVKALTFKAIRGLRAALDIELED